MLYRLNYWPVFKVPLHFFVQRVTTTESAVLLELQLGRLLLLVAVSRVIAPLTLCALEVYDIARHLPYSRISVMEPAPTVRPPSRIAKRSPFSIAIGVISSTDRFVLSPGITISTPSDSVATPVTSVVRK